MIMVTRSRVRRRPLPPTPTKDPTTGIPYEQLATETLDEMRARLACEPPAPSDYLPEKFASPADMYSWMTGMPPETWPDFIGKVEWQDRQQLEAGQALAIKGPDDTQPIVATVVQPTVADRYTALAPENIVVIHGEVVD